MGFTASARARSALVTTSAAAPSLRPLAFPAVTVPSFLNAGLSFASDSRVASARGCSSVSTSRSSPFFWGTGTGAISALKRPSRIAAAVRAWLSAANASWSSRLMPYRSTRFSAVIPMWMSWKASVRPSWIMWSRTFPLPSRSPHRAPGRRKGARLMLSMPPAITISASSALIAWAASITAFNPEPQTLLTVCAGTDSGSPDRIATWRAGFMPWPAWRTFPTMTSSTWSRRTPERATASRTATVPSSTAETSLNAPPKVPMGVRHPARMTMSFMIPILPADRGEAEGEPARGRAVGRARVQLAVDRVPRDLPREHADVRARANLEVQHALLHGHLLERDGHAHAPRARGERPREAAVAAPELDHHGL